MSDVRRYFRNDAAPSGMREDALGHWIKAADYDALTARVAELEAAVKQSMVAIDDWLNIYASEFCDPQRVAEAYARIRAGGTLGYIAKVQAINSACFAGADNSVQSEQPDDVGEKHEHR